MRRQEKDSTPVLEQEPQIIETLWRNARIYTAGDPGNTIEPAAIAVQGERIAWIGGDHDVPPELVAAAQGTHDLERRWVTPGLVDCHTHLVYGGCRADEFQMRLGGASYAEIARAGGGINSTVRATRLAGEESLLNQSARRLKGLLAEGVTAVEVKSGYGLNLDDERKMLHDPKNLAGFGVETGLGTFVPFGGLGLTAWKRLT